MLSNYNESYHHLLFPYAYNILGIVEEAEDAVQDVILKHLTGTSTELENEKAYLIRSVINHSVNKKKRNSKIVHDASWLPEPIETHGADHSVNSRDILSYSLLVLMERLTPKERAVFILKRAFDYSHDEIAGIFSFTVDNSRKLFSRANSKLDGVKREEKQLKFGNLDMLNSYISVIRRGDIASLERMLSADILVTADGGSKLNVVSKMSMGAVNASRLMLYVYEKYQQNFVMEQVFINHQPALLFFNKGVLINCQVFEFEEDNIKIRRIYSIVDTDKLKNIRSF